MSVIIRLQNLPWTANAVDVRHLFQGLTIPDGGVHIVGGERGDVFIAFATDEDARLAMLRDGSCINNVQIKLFLSSKTEMLNVINAAKGVPASVSQTPQPNPGLPGQMMLPSTAGQPVHYDAGIPSSSQLLHPVLAGNPPYVGPNERNVMPTPPAPQWIFSIPPPVLPPAPANNAFVGGPGLFTRPPNAPVEIAGGLAISQPVVPLVDSNMRDIASSLVPPGQPPFPMFPPHPSNPIHHFAGPGQQPVSNRPPVDCGGGRAGGLSYNNDQRDSFQRRPDPFQSSGLNRPFEHGGNRGVSGEEKFESGKPGQFGTVNIQQKPGQSFTKERKSRFSDVPHQNVNNSSVKQDATYTAGTKAVAQKPSRVEAVKGKADDVRTRQADNLRTRQAINQRGGGGKETKDENRSSNRTDGNKRNGRLATAPDTQTEPPAKRAKQSQSQTQFSSGTTDGRRHQGDNAVSRGGNMKQTPKSVEQRSAKSESKQREADEKSANEKSLHAQRKVDKKTARKSSPLQAHGNSTCVRCSGFPRSYNYKGVRRFFVGCDIPHQGIKMMNMKDGHRSGIAYVQFDNERSALKALDMDGKLAENCKVAVSRCSVSQYNDVEDGAVEEGARERPRPPKRDRFAQNPKGDPPGTFYFIVRKLPINTDRNDLKKFFDKFCIVEDGGPFFELNQDGDRTGNALVAIDKLGNAGEVIVHMDRAKLKGASVSVISIDKAEYEEKRWNSRQSVRAEVRANNQRSGERPDLHVMGSKDSKVRSCCCVQLKGVPYDIDIPTILDFFNGLDIVRDGIHIVYNRLHRATGYAFVEFSNAIHCARALQLNNQSIRKRNIEIEAIDRKDMFDMYHQLQQQCGTFIREDFVNDYNAATAGSGGGESGSLNIDPARAVSMANLHPDTQLEDIVEFFENFYPIADSIKLQYKDGKPTGDGVVEFNSRMDAVVAVNARDQCYLLGRMIELSLWSANM